MNSTNFIQTGGWPLNAERLQELQTSYAIFNAFGSIAGNLTIISGCETVGGTVQNGRVYINGELYDFRQAVVSGGSRVIVIEEAVNRPFENGSIKQVHTIKYATFGTSDVSWAWADFEKPIETKLIKSLLDGIAVTINAINTRLLTAEAKLATIAFGAQVNVQADWSITDSNSPAFIKNKGRFPNLLAMGKKNIGNLTSNSYSVVVNFDDVGTTDYMVVGSVVSNSVDFNQDNNVFDNTREHTRTSFRLCLREMQGIDQNISFNYMIFKF
jgi:hypothetical protein